MKIAVYGRRFSANVVAFIREVFEGLEQHKAEIYVHSDLHNELGKEIYSERTPELFTTHEDIAGKIDVMLSLGGDGTLLDTVALIRDSGIPVIGINFGRLGFLASINKNDIADALKALTSREFTYDERNLISLHSDEGLFGDDNFALNDVTIHKRDDAAMITIHAFINGEFLNSYWGDGIIVSTPTGSTAYSLSCGGPIVFPKSGNLVLTPVAPHNLNVRPVVLSDDTELYFEVESRSASYLISCDSRTVTIDRSVKFSVKTAPFKINLIRLYNENYLTTLRNKLLWGLDARNY
ncbi:MAG: NAD kinase [Mucilaginibacter polytrichastri]|nr:NAD kinase [Mucilaginibacter polytrichastri]